MAEEKNQNNSICTETESSMVINSAEESANQKFEQTQGSQHHHIKEEYDLDLPLNLSSIETHIPLEGNLFWNICSYLINLIPQIYFL